MDLLALVLDWFKNNVKRENALLIICSIFIGILIGIVGYNALLSPQFRIPQIVSELQECKPYKQFNSKVSSFNAGYDEDWSTIYPPPPHYINKQGVSGKRGGKDDGYLESTNDPEGKVNYYKAPSSFDGDWRLYKELKISLKSSGGNKPFFNHPDIRIFNKKKSAEYFFRTRPEEEWETFLVPLEENQGWKLKGGASSLQEVLKNITDFEIRAEYSSGYDKSGLDDVTLTAFPPIKFQLCNN
ncbi:MAG: hypothetical protein F6K10_23270 [Moorea sp. SIO2B7]|nr:hypothetical protein [Moorena sp. SIO2B7]